MARIYVSYNRHDQQFVDHLVSRLKYRHEIFCDSFLAGDAWRSKLDVALKSSDVFIVVFSRDTERSQYVLTELGAARAYSSESTRMLLIPLVIDDMSLPLSIQDIHAIIQPDRNMDEIVEKIESSISAFIGRKAAREAEETDAAQRIESNAADFIKVAIQSLEAMSKRDRLLSYLWYTIGFVALIAGVIFSGWSLYTYSANNDVPITSLLLAAIKTLVIIGFIGACAKYAFSLGKSYSSESLKCSDRMHAIRFGEFYLRAFGSKIKWEELKDVFQHWNIDRRSAFSELESSQFDPKIIESIIELAKSIRESKLNK